MKFTASIAALVLLQGFAMALPREPGVEAVGENRLPLTYPKAKAPHKGGSCKPKRPTPVGPDVPKNTTLPGTEPGDNPAKPSPPNEAEGGDDYPYKGKCGQRDRWDLTACQCTSFVAHRVDPDGKKGFKDKGPWRNANQWKDNAVKNGITVDDKPAVGAIAWTAEGTYGHVAYMRGVDGDKADIEDYNGLGGNEQYGSGKVPASKYQYIHVEKYFV
ncbi:N-acetylmuramoyl-L-alanine amidase sle1 [Metarhizium anisopliae]|nr:N-acetylmuramoyl-L-alanine amidase sle1 [Metarhizium anisopliae]